MSDDREAILSRVRGALAPLRERASLPQYDSEIAVMRKLIAGRDLAELFAERIKRVNGQAFTDLAALVTHLRTNQWLRGYCDPALWGKLAPSEAGETRVSRVSPVRKAALIQLTLTPPRVFS